MISVFGWNGSYIVSCCGAMFGTGNFVLLKNLVKNIKIFHLRPFAAICDHFEAPHSQKDVQESEMAYSPFSCLYLGSWQVKMESKQLCPVYISKPLKLFQWYISITTRYHDNRITLRTYSRNLCLISIDFYDFHWQCVYLEIVYDRVQESVLK